MSPKLPSTDPGATTRRDTIVRQTSKGDTSKSGSSPDRKDQPGAKALISEPGGLATPDSD